MEKKTLLIVGIALCLFQDYARGLPSNLLQLEFAQSNYSGLERYGYISVTLLLKGNSILTHDIAVTVRPTDQSPVSAEGNGVDYDSNPITALFNAGANSTTINIPVINDNITEETETFDLSLTIPSLLSGQVVLGHISKATGSIIDDTIATIRFNDSIYIADEGSRVVHPALLLSNPLSKNITLELVNTDVSAFGDSLDYETGPYLVRINAGETSVLLSIPINDDDILEGNEEFHLSFNLSMLPSRVNVTNPEQATVIIMDDDDAEVSFEHPTYTVNEIDGKIEPVLVLSNPSSTDITVLVHCIDGSATGKGVDYISGQYPAHFTASETNVSFSVPIHNDNLFEDSETFICKILHSLPRNVIVGNPYQSTITILKNDDVVLSFEQETYAVNESDRKVEPALILSKPPSDNIIVQVLCIDGSATGGGVDYSLGSHNAQFNATNTIVSFGVLIHNDDLSEDSEDFTCRIDKSSLPSCVTVDHPDQAKITILKNDVPSVEFDQMVYSGSEASGIISVTLLLRGGISNYDISVTVMPSDRSPVSAEGGVDYGSTPINATFTIGSTSTTVNIPLTKDNIAEELEKFDITIAIPSSFKDQVILGDVTNAFGTIIDNTITMMGFREPTITVDEDIKLVQISISLSNPLSSTITFQVYGTDVTATGGGVDYDSGPYTMIIPAKEEEGSISVSINDDSILEQNELFRLTVNSSSLPSRVITSPRNRVDVIIIDNDATAVNFSQPIYIVNENSGPVQLMLDLSNPSSTTIIVEVININITAIGGGVDYESGPYIVMIPAGMTNVPFYVAITDDNLLEETENFNLTISALSLPNRVAVTNPHQATVTIVDNDDVCKVTIISGGFKMINGSLIFEFSGNHPNAIYQCLIDSGGIRNCKSPLTLERRVGAVIVTAYCYINGSIWQQMRKVFRNYF